MKIIEILVIIISLVIVLSVIILSVINKKKNKGCNCCNQSEKCKFCPKSKISYNDCETPISSPKDNV